ncbi:MAG: TIGR02757 family protein [Bacteroidetes bacterium]|nr:TIGR02757 family protein [Bacteroidota bacterium]MBS1649028.1 TIGR02757 family protein [Bacteroidota bacterium]
MTQHALKIFLDLKVEQYNQPSFITKDPISIPHLFTKKQDIEIAAFYASIFAWGNRTIIINKSKELMQLFEMQPYQFITQHSSKDLKTLLQFKHRTFNATDLLYFIEFLKHHYSTHKTLETAFTKHGNTVEAMLIGFHNYFFSLNEFPERTKKHIATPHKKSNAKRLNMFLRWMVRNDNKGVDFGLWKNIHPSQLIIPIDVHVARVAKHFNLLPRQQIDWQAAVELTNILKTFDAADPVKYDFALFGLGVMEKY